MQARPPDPARSGPLSIATLDAAIAASRSGRPAARYGDVHLRSHFQPIMSLAHGRSIGYEALLRGEDADGRALNPVDVLSRPADLGERTYLDHLAHAVHLQSFVSLGLPAQWLFLNVLPDVFLRAPDHGRLFADLLKSRRFPRKRVVLEVLEQRVAKGAAYDAAVEHFRELGCLIALDDFGAGHSNFDRVWNLRPDLVKLDRSMSVQAAADPMVRRMLPSIVSLLHEAGSLVVLEGVETRDQALIAMEADVDFVQGWFFGRPEPTAIDPNPLRRLFDELWNAFHARIEPAREAYREAIAPYQHAFGNAAHLVEAGLPPHVACRAFLAQPRATCAFIVDERGWQISPDLRPEGVTGEQDRFALAPAGSPANWSRRPYFRRAIEHPGKVQVSRPHLPLDESVQCVTLSIAIRIPGQPVQVLCGHVRWNDRGSGIH